MRITVCTPVHGMENGEYFLKRLIASLDKQTFRDFEHVITRDGKMAENTNSAIKQAKGDIIKILYMDDYFYNPDALQNLSNEFNGGWFASGCVHDNGVEVGGPHIPKNLPDNVTNTIGSPSVVAFENNDPLLFDENLSWMLDIELYSRLYERYGEPTLIDSLDVAIGLHRGQTTHILSEKEKQDEVIYVQNHGTN